jgi:hypothetical protein
VARPSTLARSGPPTLGRSGPGEEQSPESGSGTKSGTGGSHRPILTRPGPPVGGRTGRPPVRVMAAPPAVGAGFARDVRGQPWGSRDGPSIRMVVH